MRKNKRIIITLSFFACVMLVLGGAICGGYYLERKALVRTTELIWIIAVSAVLLLILFLIYFLWNLRDVHRENVISERQLRNVNYILEVEKQLFDAYLQPKHFLDAMQCVAEYLGAEVVFLWLTEKGAQTTCCWSSSEHSFLRPEIGFKERYPVIYENAVQEEGIFVMGKEELCRRFAEEGEEISNQQVHSLMIDPVHDADGEFAFVMGACNFEQSWNMLKPLKQIALSFTMALKQYEVCNHLAQMGRVDSMTGLMNRNSYHQTLERLEQEKPQTIGCIYVDVNGLHELNNCLGHEAGDEMLKTTADMLRKHFCGEEIFRIGGDEFVVLCRDWSEGTLQEMISQTKTELRHYGYEVSTGLAWQEGECQLDVIVSLAEQRMREDKQAFYRHGGKERNRRVLNQEMEQILEEKKDTEQFLSVLEPEFRGVYFVELESDTVRHIFIPDYFEKILEEAGESYGKALMDYAGQIAKEEYLPNFKQVCDYEWLREQLENGKLPEFSYQTRAELWIQLRILKLNSDEETGYKTLWIFTEL